MDKKLSNVKKIQSMSELSLDDIKQKQSSKKKNPKSDEKSHLVHNLLYEDSETSNKDHGTHQDDKEVDDEYECENDNDDYDINDSDEDNEALPKENKTDPISEPINRTNSNSGDNESGSISAGNSDGIHSLSNEVNQSDIEPVHEVVLVKAVVLTDYGINNIKIKEVKLRDLGPQDVKIEVWCLGLNFSDIYTINGLFEPVTTPFILGFECSGIVKEIGTDVGPQIKVNQGVAVYCPSGGLFQETVVINKKYVFPTNTLNLETAAALPVNYVTAFDILDGITTKGESSLLFHGCGGGVGTALYDIQRLGENKINLLGTCSSHKHTALMKMYKCFDYVDWPTAIRKLYPEGVDCIVETISGSNLNKSLNCVAQNGCLVVIGASCILNPAERHTLLDSREVDLKQLIMNNIAVRGINISTKLHKNPARFHTVMEYIINKANAGLIRPKIYRVFPFLKIHEAINTLVNRQNIGKVLLSLNRERDIRDYKKGQGK
ncbi:synaptic vesicle membrane protein VAT-1 homolog [Lycorma delicatula]|uniref:synaptic vesicle membrane protein VAT-1 homolog n=1 Tax=Lycorma delicatula TaxID=130591 RepID=UPI003F511599